MVITDKIHLYLRTMDTFKDNRITVNSFFREFSPEVEESQLIWHRDKCDRRVTVMSGKNWKIQFDNELPKELIPGKIFFIPKMVFHRIWRGEDMLRLRIEEN